MSRWPRVRESCGSCVAATAVIWSAVVVHVPVLSFEATLELGVPLALATVHALPDPLLLWRKRSKRPAAQVPAEPPLSDTYGVPEQFEVV
jgi:hypothetical protein